MTEWQKSLQSGNYETRVVEINLSKPNGPLLKGSGQLSWSADQGIRLRLLLDSSQPDFQNPLLDSPKLGEFITPDKFYSLSARTDDGWRATISGIYEGELTSRFLSSFLTWNLEPKCVSFSKNEKPLGKSRIAGILRPIERTEFCRLSRFTDDNPHFGSQGFHRDWLTFDTPFATAVARRLTNNHMVVQLVADDDQHDLTRAIEAVRLGFSYLEGRSLQMLGYEEVRGSLVTRTLFTTRVTSRNTFPSPLRDLKDSHEEFLRAATAFFFTPTGKRFADYLRMSWDVNDNMGTVRAIASSTSVEAMINLLIRGKRPALTDDHKQVSARRKLISYLTKRSHKYGERFVNRIGGLMTSGDQLNVKRTLRNWSRNGLMGIQESEIEAWDKIRNSSAHGKLLFIEDETKKRQDNIRMLYRVQNLINRLTLHSMGYRGKFLDYSTWSVADFNPAEEDDIVRSLE